jgi:hypothetical protein
MAADTPKYLGFIDGLLGDRICGWFLREGDERPLSLELLINDEIVASFIADGERADLAPFGFGSVRHGFTSPRVLQNIPPDAIIRVKVAGTDMEVPQSGRPFSDYRLIVPRQYASYQSDQGPTRFGKLADRAEFIGLRTSAFPEVRGLDTFRSSSFANLVVEPPGTMRLPPCRVANRAEGSYRLQTPSGVASGGGFPAALKFPKMTITTLENAYCLPFSPPILPPQRNIITDFLIPWAPNVAPWFEYAGSNVYHANVPIDLDNPLYDIDTAFYMDHSISVHFGHFVGDCLCRVYAWEVLRNIFGDVKLIIGSRKGLDFQDHLLSAAGVAENDIVRINNLTRCKRLLLATQALGVEQYATPTASRLWAKIRDRCATRDISMPDRIYLTRSGMPTRRLLNETAVEQIFERHGFTIVRPELLTVAQQMALASNALLIAGPAGSAMFNLAFQGRLRSAFILAREARLQLTEMLLCAGGSCDLWYHAGRDAVPGGALSDGNPWLVDPLELESNVADWIAASGV